MKYTSKVCSLCADEINMQMKSQVTFDPVHVKLDHRNDHLNLKITKRTQQPCVTYELISQRPPDLWIWPEGVLSVCSAVIVYKTTYTRTVWC